MKMEERQYIDICKNCDEILMDKESGIACTAIPFLHIIREHPIFLENYKVLTDSASWLSTFLQGLKLIVRSLAGFAYRMLFSEGKNFWQSNSSLPNTADLVIVSHLINESHAGKDSDFYFGNLPQQLNSLGYSVVLVLMNHTERKAEDLIKSWSGSRLPVLILSDSMNRKNELNLIWQSIKESVRLKKYSLNKSNSLKRKIASRASVEALSGRSISTLRMYWQMRSVFSKVKPSSVLITFEGHAWERLTFAAAHSAFSGCKCMAYQHSALFRLQHAIRRKLNPKYNPDVILTSGILGRDQLKLSTDLFDTKILVLGSDRAIDVFKNDKSDEIQYNKQACLVLPEGIESECNLLFNLSLDCARQNPHLNFIWRMHPLLPFEIFVANNPDLKILPTNIILSTDSIEKDFLASKWVLYRGTTAVVKAIGFKIKPIYLSIPGEMSIDPLYELDQWHEFVSNSEEMTELLQTDLAKSTEDFMNGFDVAKKYCENFFSPFSVNILSSLLKSNKV